MHEPEGGPPPEDLATLVRLDDDALGSVFAALVRATALRDKGGRILGGSPAAARRAVACIAATCLRLREATRPELARLEQQMVAALEDKLGRTLTSTLAIDRPTELNLAGRQLQNEDCMVLAKALRDGRLPSDRPIVELNLNNNGFEDGLAPLASAFGARPLAGLLRLYLNGNGIGDRGAAALGEALSTGALPALQFLSAGNNRIGCSGTRALVSAARLHEPCRHLRRLYLHYNAVGDAGMFALADALATGAFGALNKLYIDNNAFGVSGKRAVLGVCVSRMIQHDLGLPPGSEAPRGTLSTSSAARSSFLQRRPH